MDLRRAVITQSPLNRKKLQGRGDKHGKPSKLVTVVPLSWRRKAQRTANVIESFFHAFRGFWIAFQGERNLRIHVAMAIGVSIAAIVLKIDATGWALLTLAIGFVMTAELLNTALERLVDLATNNEFHRIARDAKDTAAAAVMCAAFMAVGIGLCVFVPRIMALVGLHF